MRSLQPAWETWRHTVEGSGEYGGRETDRVPQRVLSFSVKLNRPSYLLLEVLADSSRYIPQFASSESLQGAYPADDKIP